MTGQRDRSAILKLLYDVFDIAALKAFNGLRRIGFVMNDWKVKLKNEN